MPTSWPGMIGNSLVLIIAHGMLSRSSEHSGADCVIYLVAEIGNQCLICLYCHSVSVLLSQPLDLGMCKCRLRACSILHEQVLGRATDFTPGICSACQLLLSSTNVNSLNQSLAQENALAHIDMRGDISICKHGALPLLCASR